MPDGRWKYGVQGISSDANPHQPEGNPPIDLRGHLAMPVEARIMNIGAWTSGWTPWVGAPARKEACT